ncbi:protein FAM72, partial [Radiomyces spectabilis]|uniref:protein FAM72 n=1 Tax=Radiomyces spectabilis TaxID=64574 RepID=UPI0022208B45
CRDCKAVITDRGMSAILLSDHSIQLFSTDLFPDTVGFVHGDYSASSCGCRVRDTACLECGNVIGYHVNVPCKVCLEQNHNG